MTAVASPNVQPLHAKPPLRAAASRTADKFVIRLPDGMRSEIAEVAKNHYRSMNNEIIDTMSMHLKLLEMGHRPLLERLSKGEKLSSITAALRAGDPVTYNEALWIIEKLTVRNNAVYADLTRESPATGLTDNTTVRYSELKPLLG